jgi:hypothetical protein
MRTAARITKQIIGQFRVAARKSPALWIPSHTRAREPAAGEDAEMHSFSPFFG